MTDLQFTQEQRQVIDQRERNLIVSAQAGAGKTAVLVERVLSELVEGHRSIREMLIVTFTNKAAHSLRDKIRARLMELIRSESYPGMDGSGQTISSELRTHLLDQVNALASANIQTLHAFCYEQVQGHFDALGLDPTTHILDERTLSDLQNKALDRSLSAFYESGSTAFQTFAELFGTDQRRTDQALRQMILAYQRMKDQLLDPDRWLKETSDAMGTKAYGRETIRLYYQKFILPDLTAYRASYDALLDQAKRHLPEAYAKAIEGEPVQFSQAVTAYIEKGERDPLLHFKSPTAFPMRKNKYDEAVLAEKDRLNAWRKTLKEEQEKISQQVLALNEKALVEEGGRMRQNLLLLDRLASDYRTVLRQLKKEKHGMDFNDVEHLLLALLDQEEIQRALQARYQSIYFDEYQDASDLQNEIIERLKGDRNLFFVGDVKQSIYAFRQACPENFLERMDQYEKDPARSSACYLTYNFRSEKNILDFINWVFDPLMTPDRGQVAYQTKGQRARVSLPAQKRAQEVETSGGLAGQVELVLIEEEKGEKKELSYIDEKPAEAFYLAHWIQAYLAEDPSHSYRDITVLFRAKQPIMDYEAVLRHFSIPTYSDMDAFDQEALEIALAIHLFEWVDNRYHDLALAALLSSIVGDFSDEELALLRFFYPDGSFAQAFYALVDQPVCNPAEGWAQGVASEEDLITLMAAYPALHDKALRFAQARERWIQDGQRMPFGDFIAHLLQQSGLYPFLSALSYGQERRANLQLLMTMARHFEEEGGHDLYGFLQLLKENGSSQGQGLQVAGAMSESDQVVRLMSIHASKGLDAPVIVLANLPNSFHPASTLPYSFDRSFGASLADRSLDPKSGRILEGPSVRLDLDQRRRWARERDEEVRIFYVALTRAQKRLVLLGHGKDLSEALRLTGQAHVQELSMALDQGRSYQDWLLALLKADPGKMRDLQGGLGQALRAGDFASGKIDFPSAPQDRQQVAGFTVTLERESDVRKQMQVVKQTRNTEQGLETTSLVALLQEGQASILPSMDAVLSFRYPFSESCYLPIKRSVTGLMEEAFEKGKGKRKTPSPLGSARRDKGEKDQKSDFLLTDQEGAADYAPPRFIREEPDRAGAHFGRLMHAALQALPLRAYEPASLEVALEALVKRRFFLREEADQIDRTMLLQFYQSPLGRRLIRLREAVRREESFTIRTPLSKLPFARQREGGSEEIMTIDGRVDLFVPLAEADPKEAGLLLVDFKTDRKKDPAHYRDQLALYALALSQAYQQPVTEAYLYWVRYGEAERFTDLLPPTE